jgi:hypothetical protein
MNYRQLHHDQQSTDHNQHRHNAPELESLTALAMVIVMMMVW